MTFKLTPSLRLRLILPLLAAFSVLTGLLVWQPLNQRDYMMRVATDDLMDHALLIAAKQQFIVAKAREILNSAMLRPEMHANTPTESCLRYFGERIRQEIEFAQMGRVLPNGALACAAHYPRDREVNYTDRYWFQQAYRTNGMVVSAVVHGDPLGKPLLVFAQAMRDRSGQVDSVFYVSLDLDWLQRELEETGASTAGQLIVFDTTGTIAARYPATGEWIGTSIAERPLFKQIMASGKNTGILREVGPNGERDLAVHTLFLDADSGIKYHLLLLIPEAVVWAPAQRQLLISLMLAGTLVACTVGWLLWRSNQFLVRPLMALSQTAVRFGAGDYRARTGVPHGTDDIGRLAQALDEAGANIQDRDGRLQRAQAELRKLSLAVEQSPEIIIITDLASRIEYVNESFVRSTGYSREEAIGRKPQFKRSQRTPPETYEVLLDTLARGGTWKGEYYSRRKDGSEYLASALITPIFQADGQASHYLGIEKDVTERRRVADELNRYQNHLEDLVRDRTAQLEASNAEREKASLALQAAYGELEDRVVERTRQLRQLAVDATLAEERERRAIARDLHDDLGQILHVAKIKLDALIRKVPADTAGALGRELDRLISSASARVRSLTSQLSPPVLHTMGLVPALAWLAEEMERSYGLIVEVEDDGRPKPLTPAQSAILFRAVRELLINVSKHAGTAFARVEAAVDGDFLVLRVEDEGTGIGDVGKALSGHRGYGLASVRERITFLSGAMDIRANPGEGVTVSLRMPLDRAKAASAAAAV